jgi:hypothetical protein
MRCTPRKPQATYSRKKAVQKAASSLNPMSKPKISRSPDCDTPVATTKAMPAHDPLPGLQGLALAPDIPRPEGRGFTTCFGNSWQDKRPRTKVHGSCLRKLHDLFDSLGQDACNGPSDSQSEERWHGIPDLLDDLRPCAFELEGVVKTLKPRTLPGCQGAVLNRMDALVRRRMHKVDRNSRGGFRSR